MIYRSNQANPFQCHVTPIPKNFRSTYVWTVLISTSSKHRDSHSPLHPVESRPLTRWSQRNLGHRASHHDSCRTGNRHLHTVFLRTRLLETVKHQLLNYRKNIFQGTKISHLGKRKIDKSCLHSSKWSFANQVSVLVDILRSLRILFLRVGWSQNRRPSK